MRRNDVWIQRYEITTGVPGEARAAEEVVDLKWPRAVEPQRVQIEIDVA